MKEKRNKKAEQATGSANSGTRSEDNEIRKKEREMESEEHIKTERHWTKRPAKRMYHPDGPGGGYDGL